MWRFIFSVLILLGTLALNPKTVLVQSQTTTSECQPFPFIGGIDNFPEVEGRSDQQELWALVFRNPAPFEINEAIKIVWRMTGSGTFNIAARHSDGTMIDPIWGPEEHGGSTWDRPGDEWGTGFRFPKAGCWRITVTRGNATGEVDFLVIDSNKLEFF